MGLDEIPGFSVRIIPTATSLFSILKLNMKRNNIRSLKQGCMFYLIQAFRFLSFVVIFYFLFIFNFNF